MSTVRERWLRRLNTARLWERIQRQRYIWHPTAENKKRLLERRAQVAEAERVLKRHPAHPPKRKATGIDVSNNNGHVDFAKVKAAGESFVWVKAGEGDWKDPLYTDNVKRAVAAGLKVGGYQFLRPRIRGGQTAGASGRSEAKWFADRLKAAGLGAGDLRPVADIEVTALSKSQTRNYLEGFIGELRVQGLHPMIYTGTWFWEPHVGGDDLGCLLWLAAYVDESKIDLPGAWEKSGYTVWQYTDHAAVPGAGNVDRNRCDDFDAIIV